MWSLPSGDYSPGGRGQGSGAELAVECQIVHSAWDSLGLGVPRREPSGGPGTTHSQIIGLGVHKRCMVPRATGLP